MPETPAQEIPATVGIFTIVHVEGRARRESKPQLTLTVQESGATSSRLSQAANAWLVEHYGKNPKVLIGAADGQIAVLVNKAGHPLADSGSLSGPDVYAAFGQPEEAGVYVIPVVGETGIKGVVGHVSNAKRKDIRVRAGQTEDEAAAEAEAEAEAEGDASAEAPTA